jgi:competence protein ComEA
VTVRRRSLALGLVFAMATALALEPVDVNTGNRAQLEQLRGIGPPLAESILMERDARGPFKDWADLIARVRGIRAAKARQLSDAGLRVGAAPFAAPLP